MLKLSLIILSLILSSPAFADRDTKSHFINRIWAATLAIQLSKIEKPQDFVEKLPLTERDRELIEQEIKSGRMKNYSRPQISMPTDTKIVITSNKQSVEMDFHEFHLGRLYINKTKIALNKDTDYLHFRFQVEQALKNKVSLWSLALPQAVAEGTSTVVAQLAAAAASSSNGMLSFDYVLPDDTAIDQTLIATYKRIAQEARDNGKPFSTTQFVCNGPALTALYSGDVQTCNPATHSKCDYLVQGELTKNRINYTYHSETCEGKGVQFSSDLKLENLNFQKTKVIEANTCPNEGTWTADPVKNYMDIANGCCQKSGCYEKVRSELDQLMNNQGKKTEATPAEPTAVD